MAKKLAFMTLGTLKEPMGQPAVQGFLDRVPGAYGAAEASHGFISRSERDMATLDHSWGNLIVPAAYSEFDDINLLPSTLSLWEDLESVAAYAYNGAHGEALANRKEWFVQDGKPKYVAWWVEETDRLSREEAAERFDHLAENGPTPYAFNFAKPFDAEGNPYKIDRDRIKAKIAMKPPSVG